MRLNPLKARASTSWGTLLACPSYSAFERLNSGIQNTGKLAACPTRKGQRFPTRMSVAELARKAQQAPTEMTAIERAVLVMHQGMLNEKDEIKLRAAATVAQLEAINQRDDLARKRRDARSERMRSRRATETPRPTLHEFVRQAWPHLETDVAFVDNWHIQALCEHLEAVLDGRISQLLVNVPPGCMKSLLTAVFLPMWAWGPRGKPETRWMFISYDQKLSTRDSRKCRTLLNSDWYQGHWGHVFRSWPTRIRSRGSTTTRWAGGLPRRWAGWGPASIPTCSSPTISSTRPRRRARPNARAASIGGTPRFRPAACRAACGGSSSASGCTKTTCPGICWRKVAGSTFACRWSSSPTA